MIDDFSHMPPFNVSSDHFVLQGTAEVTRGSKATASLAVKAIAVALLSFLLGSFLPGKLGFLVPYVVAPLALFLSMVLSAIFLLQGSEATDFFTSFAIDFSESPPTWQSDDDDFWEEVRLFFEIGATGETTLAEPYREVSSPPSVSEGDDQMTTLSPPTVISEQDDHMATHKSSPLKRVWIWSGIAVLLMCGVGVVFQFFDDSSGAGIPDTAEINKHESASPGPTQAKASDAAKTPAGAQPAAKKPVDDVANTPSVGNGTAEESVTTAAIVVEKLREMDQDRDGFIDRSEATGPLVREKFTALDKNGDGRLSRQELKQALVKLKRRKKRGCLCPSPPDDAAMSGSDLAG